MGLSIVISNLKKKRFCHFCVAQNIKKINSDFACLWDTSLATFRRLFHNVLKLVLPPTHNTLR
jgi:hypothetical protein